MTSDTEVTAAAGPKKVTGRVSHLGVPRDARARHKVDVHGKPLDPALGTPDVGLPSGAGATGAMPGVTSELRTPSAAATIPLPGGRTAQPYDPRSPLPLPERLRALAGDLADMASRVGVKLGLACGRALTVSCEGVGRLPAATLAGVGSFWSSAEAGLGRPGVLVTDDALAVALADLMLGGTGAVATRPVHRVEAAVLRRHLATALLPLIEPLAEHGVSGIALDEPPVDDIVAFLGGAEVIAIRLQIGVGDTSLPGALLLALPARPLLGGAEPIRTVQSTERALAGVPVDVTVQFPETTFSAYEMTGLERGDVLRLEVGDPLVVGQIDGRPLLTASLGRSGRRRAIVVHSVTGGRHD